MIHEPFSVVRELSGAARGGTRMCTPSAPPSRRPFGPRAAALVAGLLLGAGGVGAPWALTGEDTDTPGSGPAGDAHAACAAFDGFDETKWGTEGKEGDIAINRFSAAGILANAAAAGDKRYKPLAEAINRTQNRYAQELGFTAKVKKDLGQARDLCEDL